MIDITKIDFEKGKGLVPAIVQDSLSMNVLMLGYMNEEALKTTIESKFVTFFSRSKNRLWKKGETSGNTMKVVSLSHDCDNDSLLVLALPAGPACHTGSFSCFGDEEFEGMQFLSKLQATISERKKKPVEGSYTNLLFAKGLTRISQKVGEEATEVVIAALAESKEKLVEESSDLVYHLLVLLSAKDVSLEDVVSALKSRNK